MLNEDNQALWDVVRVALVCMMLVQLFGNTWDYWFKMPTVVSYECDFQMADHVVTMPCEIRNVAFSSD